MSFIWPLTALGFVITTFAARYILHEQVTTLRWTGVALIVLGAALITLSGNPQTAASPETESKIQRAAD